MKAKRMFCLLLAICLAAGPIPTVALAAENDRAIMRSTAQLQGGQADSIYFGTYQQTGNSSGYDTDPVKWRVLANDEDSSGKLFLLADQNLDVKPYHNDYTSMTWENSSLRAWLNGTFLSAAFSSGEQGAIATTIVANKDNPEFNTEGGNDTEDKIFLLSIEEALNTAYGFSSDYSTNSASGRVSLNTAYAKKQGAYTYKGAGNWWLRSSGYEERLATLVHYDGFLSRFGDFTYLKSIGVRPAFHLNLSSVLFASAATGGKAADTGGRAADTIFEIGDYTGSEWKLTLLDSSRQHFSISNATIVRSHNKNTIEFSYSEAKTGTKEYISAIIESNNEITHYGRILQLNGTTNGTSGTASFTLPKGVTLNDTTKLYLFNEQYNGDYRTDYASQLINVQPAMDTPAPDIPDPDDNPYVTYTVQRGDTLWAISRKYDCTVSELVARNRKLIKNPDLIFAGWKLKIPQE